MSSLMSVSSKAQIKRIAVSMMATKDWPAHHFDFKRWLTWGEPTRTEQDKEYPEGYPSEQECLPDPENEFEEEE